MADTMTVVGVGMDWVQIRGGRYLPWREVFATRREFNMFRDNFNGNVEVPRLIERRRQGE